MLQSIGSSTSGAVGTAPLPTNQQSENTIPNEKKTNPTEDPQLGTQARGGL